MYVSGDGLVPFACVSSLPRRGHRAGARLGSLSVLDLVEAAASLRGLLLHLYVRLFPCPLGEAVGSKCESV